MIPPTNEKHLQIYKVKIYRMPVLHRKMPAVGKNDLGIVSPKQVERWDYSKKQRLPEEYFSDGTTSVWWKCEECIASVYPFVRNAPWRK